MTGRLRKLANLIMLLMFVFSAVVQLNDPDPVRWTAMYCAAAAMCALEIRRPISAWVPATLAIIALVWAGTLYGRAHSVPLSALVAEWEMKNPNIEEAREMYGLTIVAIWMLAIVGVRWARARVTAPTKRTSGPS
jgi:hypothetical protein